MSENKTHLLRAVTLARDNALRGGRPFGAVLVRNGTILAEAVNTTETTHDPTAHAELLALREAGRTAGTSNLDGAVVYASGHPCPMCFAAMRLAKVSEVVFAYSNEDGAPYGMSTEWLYEEMRDPFGTSGMKSRYCSVRLEDGTDPFEIWKTRRG